MSDILSVLQILLRQSGYSTRLAAIGERSLLVFEDESVMGFATEFETAKELTGNWQSVESSLVDQFGRAFRKAGDKAWNVYMLLLCGSGASAEEVREVQWIEENLDRTRKIAACGLRSSRLLKNYSRFHRRSC